MIEFDKLAYRFGKPTRYLRFRQGVLEQMYVVDDNMGDAPSDPVKIWLAVRGQDLPEDYKNGGV